MRDPKKFRNPVLSLPGMRRLIELPVESRQALTEVLMDLRSEASERAQKSWRRSKGPMAAYWKAVSVYAGHIARAIR